MLEPKCASCIEVRPIGGRHTRDLGFGVGGLERVIRRWEGLVLDTYGCGVSACKDDGLVSSLALREA